MKRPRVLQSMAMVVVTVAMSLFVHCQAVHTIPPAAKFLPPDGPAPTGPQNVTLEVKVVDRQSAALPGVSVTLLASDGVRAFFVTDNNGRAFLPRLQAGTYRVRAELSGFGSVVRDLQLAESTFNPVTVTLAPAVEQIITVTAETPLLDIRQAGTSSTFTQNEIGTSSGGGGYARRGRGAVSPPPPKTPPAVPESGGETYARITEAGFRDAKKDAISTFSIDVDTASFTNVRRYLREGHYPPKDAVRIEEMVNYFTYDDAPPAQTAEPFALYIEAAACPWDRQHRIVRVAVRGREIPPWQMKPNNLVFLLDVSGSMDAPDKLPLVKKALRMLVEQLRANDRVAIVVYAGNAGLVLPSTPGSDKTTIIDAIERLDAGGSTAGGEGIALAYRTARENFDPNANNRVILATDGDFNVGVSDPEGLQKLIEKEREGGIFLSVVGFGTGNTNDQTMELLADKGNGNYGYVDTELEAKKQFVTELGGTLVPIAKDVKIQVVFDPAAVAEYRLIGYENRLLATKDFDDDTKDAGELGSGHHVTALYEVVPAPAFTGGYFGVVRLRYKEPNGTTSQLIERRVADEGTTFENASNDLQFASAVSLFGMLLRGSQFANGATLDDVAAIVQRTIGTDLEGYRRSFLESVNAAKAIDSGTPVAAAFSRPD